MKDFILLAPKTATQYQDMFWRIVEGQIFIGINYPTVFDGEEGEIAALSNWLNTVGVHKHKPLNLTKTYTEEKYPSYDNYPQAINVDRITEIPKDYTGVMGVPITWLDGYYDGYEIVGLNNDSRTNDFKYLIKGTPLPDKNGVPRFGFFCKGKQVYTRILIRRKQLEEEEKRYNDALERAKRIKRGEDSWRYSDLNEIIPALEEVFPVLKGNEEEKRRKQL